MLFNENFGTEVDNKTKKWGTKVGTSAMDIRSFELIFSEPIFSSSFDRIAFNSSQFGESAESQRSHLSFTIHNENQ